MFSATAVIVLREPCEGNGMGGGHVASKAGGRRLALSVIVLGAALALFTRLTARVLQTDEAPPAASSSAK